MNPFDQRKKSILSKKDKSSIGGWDEKIKPLCDKINKKENSYTTSSCSGRIIIMMDQKKKGPGLFEGVNHEPISIKDFWRSIPKERAKMDLKFKSEPPILHVACRELKDAEILLNKVRKAGWKRSGIISLGKNIIVEIIGTNKLEFPLTKKGKLLIDENFLEIVLKRANENLKKGWKAIKDLEKTV